MMFLKWKCSAFDQESYAKNIFSTIGVSKRRKYKIQNEFSKIEATC